MEAKLRGVDFGGRGVFSSMKMRILWGGGSFD